MLNSVISDEIQRLSKQYGYEVSCLSEFAKFVLKNQKKQKKLTLKELKEAIFKYFDVDNLKELRQSSEFKLAVQDFGDINFSTLESCEKLYREFIDILPHEIGETGKDCINGINIFKYFRPWQVFDLNPIQATDSDIKSAYRELSKKYHPDNPKTGNARIFDRINQMYRSILPKTYQTTDQ
jgi:hypothetical protein